VVMIHTDIIFTLVLSFFLLFRKCPRQAKKEGEREREREIRLPKIK
jgi:hypothetical protein